MTNAGREKRAGASRSKERGTAPVRAAVRTVRIIRALLHSPAGGSLADLSHDLSLHKTTLLRLLRTLAIEGVLQKDPETGRYRPTAAFWLTVATTLPDAQSIPDGVRELLKELAAVAGATATLSLPDHDRRRMVVVIYALADRPLLVDPGALRIAPMHAVSGGKCHLASLPGDELQRWLEGDLPRVTPWTITSRAQLVKEIALIRQRGYAIGRDELAIGCAGLAVPVCDGNAMMIAAVQLVLPTSEMTEASIRRWLPPLRATAERVSELVRRASFQESDLLPRDS